jgi:hypothetical protein
VLYANQSEPRTDYRQLFAPLPFGPGDVVDALSDAGATLSQTGAEVVRGVSSRRYRVDGVDELRLGGLFALQRRFGAVLTSMTVWVDDEDRLRRLEWVEVDVERPPIADTCDAFAALDSTDF